MTLGSQTAFAERISRSAGANTMSTTSDATKQYINEGVREFAKKVHGIATSSFLTLSPKFDIGTDFAVKFTLGGNVNKYGSTDIPMVSSAINNATPTTFMGHFVSNVNAAMGSMTISMSWSPSTWIFQVFGPASATSMAIAAPTGVGYTDGVPSMFGGNQTGIGTSIDGDMPQDCNVETSLPTGFLVVQSVYYGTHRVYNAPFDVFLRPMAFGVPQYFGIRNKVIRLYPSPDQQDFFKIDYSCLPADLAVDGSSDSTTCPLPEETHMAPVYYAAASLLEESHEFDKASYFQGKFMYMANDYKMRESNNNPSLVPATNPYIPPKVVI